MRICKASEASFIETLICSLASRKILPASKDMLIIIRDKTENRNKKGLPVSLPKRLVWVVFLCFCVFSSRFDDFFNSFFDSFFSISADVRGFAFTMYQNIDDRNDIDGQTNMSLVFTKGADRLDVDHALVDFNTGFFADFICNHLGSDGAVEFARFSGFACKCDPCAVDSFGNNAHFAAQLFAKNFNDQILLRDGQLERWLFYLKDNPRRLLMKREHPELFRVQRGLTYGGMSFSAIGNRFLLERPVKLQVQCSRRMGEEELRAKLDECLRAARQGAVLVSPSISPGEKAIMRAAFEEGLPLIYLQENGFTDLAKPGGRRMEACASGQLLILAPWEHHNEKLLIKRGQCLALNDMARAICSG